MNTGFHYNRNYRDTAVFYTGSLPPTASPTLHPKRTNLFDRIEVKHFYLASKALVVVDRQNVLYGFGDGIVGHSNGLEQLDMTYEASIDTHKSDFVTASVYDTQFIFLYSNGVVYGMGHKISEKFRTDAKLLTPISSLTEHGFVNQIAVGYYHVMMMNDRHQVFSYGNEQGIGRGFQDSPPIVHYAHVMESDEKIVKFSCGYSQVAAISDHGYGYFHGYGSHGEGAGAGSPSFPTRVTSFIHYHILLKDVSCGLFHTLWVARNNKYYVSGRNEEGQLGTPTDQPHYNSFHEIKIDCPLKSIRAAPTSTVAFTQDNRILFAGSICYLDGLDKNPELTDICNVVCKDAQLPEVRAFQEFYDSPLYDRDYIPGSSYQFIVFRKKANLSNKLYGSLLAGKLSDVTILIV